MKNVIFPHKYSLCTVGSKTVLLKNPNVQFCYKLYTNCTLGKSECTVLLQTVHKLYFWKIKCTVLLPTVHKLYFWPNLQFPPTREKSKIGINFRQKSEFGMCLFFKKLKCKKINRRSPPLPTPSTPAPTICF